MRVVATEVAAVGLRAVGVACIPTLVLDAVRAARLGRAGVVAASDPPVHIVNTRNRPGAITFNFVVGTMRGFRVDARRTAGGRWRVVVSRRLPFHVCAGGTGRPSRCAMCIMTGIG